jgi:hypothetical protein
MIMHIIGRLQGDFYPIPWRAFVDGEIEVGIYAVLDQTQHTEVVMSWESCVVRPHM